MPEPTIARLVFVHKGAEWRIQAVGSDEMAVAEAWLGTLLNASTELTEELGFSVYSGRAIEDATVPFITYFFVAAEDDTHTGRNTRQANLIYQVEAVDLIPLNGEYPKVNAAVALLNDLLPVSETGNVIACQRKRPTYDEENYEVA